MASVMVDVAVEPRQRDAERLHAAHVVAQHIVPRGYLTIGYTLIDRKETPDVMEALEHALQAVRQTTMPEPRRFAVDPERIDELIDWALSRSPEDGEQIRDNAWRD